MELIPTELMDRILFATENGDIQVQLILRMTKNDADLADGRKIAHIQSLIVAESCRRQGLATQAMTALEASALRMKIETLTVAVDESNTAARALYKKLGYQEMKQTEGKPTETGTLYLKKDLSRS